MIRAIARKEMRDVMREKSLITAFLVQAFLAGFSALLLAGLTALHSPDTIEAAPDATVAYVGPGGLDVFLEGADNLDLVRLNGEDAVAAFRQGSVDAIAEERYPDAGDVRRITIIVPEGELTSTLLVTQFKSLLLDYEDSLRAERAERLDHDLVTLDRSLRPDRPYAFVHSTLLPLLVITPVFLSGAIAGDALSQESRSRTLLIMRSAPISATRLVIGKLVIPVVLVPIQVALWLLLFWANGFPTPAPWTALALATVLGLLLTAAGTIVAAVVKDESMTQAAYAVLILVLAVFSLLLPRDPLNTIALLAIDAADAAVWTTVALLSIASVATLAAAIAFTRDRIRTDRL